MAAVDNNRTAPPEGISFRPGLDAAQRLAVRTPYCDCGVHLVRIAHEADMCTWIVDEARDLAELERRLNRLEEGGFKMETVLLASAGFVIVAQRESSTVAQDEIERARR